MIGGPLPVMWDAVPVSWSEWRAEWSSLEAHLPVDALACERCGVLDRRAVSSARHPAAGRLVAFRCQHCALDSVHVLETGETWILGPEDYGPDGSHEADVLF